MIFDSSMKKLKYDIRLLEFNLNNGVITKQEYDDYIKKLDDMAQAVEPLFDSSNSESSTSSSQH